MTDIYSQYAVDTGLLETVNNIMLDQMFNAYAAQSVHRANLGLMIGNYKFQIHSQIESDEVKKNLLSNPLKDKDFLKQAGKSSNLYVLGDSA